MATATPTTLATGERAGFWVRTGAYIIDAIILSIGQAILSSILSLDPMTTGGALGLVIGLIYFVLFWSNTGHGQTPGMRVLNLKVVKTDGTELDYVQAGIRYLGLLLSFFALAIGVIWVAFDPQKQGWHDKIAGTYVITAKP